MQRQMDWAGRSTSTNRRRNIHSSLGCVRGTVGNDPDDLVPGAGRRSLGGNRPDPSAHGIVAAEHLSEETFRTQPRSRLHEIVLDVSKKYYPHRGQEEIDGQLDEAFSGKTAQVRLPTSVTCEACSGSGAKAGTKPKTCQHCNGHGRIRHTQGGFFTLERTCPVCQGRGQVIEDPCPTCSGSGRVTRERTLSVNIPPGVEDATRIRLAGEGEAGVRGGPAGDLYIFLSMAAHPLFQRDGADLHCRVPVSMVTAALGGEFEVPSIDGNKARVKVPAGTQSGRRFRLQGIGMPVLRSKQTGDMYVQVLVETPQKLTKRQRELLDEFERLSSKETHPESTGFFGKVKEFLARSGSV